MSTTYDVVVVGGGAAGLSAALTLGRARRSVLVVDAGDPRNAPAAHMHAYLGREGTPPLELLAIGRDEVRSYGGEVRTGRVVSAAPLDDRPAGEGFSVRLDDGTDVLARRLLVATGLTDVLPELPGLAEHWGEGVLHCPYCHGWEVRDTAIGVLGTGPMSVHQALMFRQWSRRVTLLQHTAPEPTPEQREELDALGITVLHGEVAEVTGEVAGVTGEVVEAASTDTVGASDGGDGADAPRRLTGVRLVDGTTVALDALVVGPRFEARSAVLASLGVEPAELMAGDVSMGAAVPTGPMGATTVPGVWAAGNVTDLKAQVLPAAAGGQAAGVAINVDLIAEDTRAAVAAHRASASATEVGA